MANEEKKGISLLAIDMTSTVDLDVDRSAHNPMALEAGGEKVFAKLLTQDGARIGEIFGLLCIHDE